MKNKIYKVALNHTTNEEVAMQLTNELCGLLNVIGSADVLRLKGLHDKYECPKCGNSPDIVRPNTQESRCFKCKLEWEY